MKVKNNIQKIIGGIAVLGSIIGGTVMFSNDVKKQDVKKTRENLIEKAENGILTYSEYKQLIAEYNAEIQRIKKDGKEFELKEINEKNSIIKQLNEKIVE